MLTRSQFLVSGLAALACAACGAEAGPTPRVRADLYVCENCEAQARKRDPATVKDWRIEIAGAAEPGERMIARGVIYKSDGKTPAPDIVLYAYHTDIGGVYGPDADSWKRPRLQGWMRTGADGRYEFSSIKPGIYPNRSASAHVHVYVLEPNRPVYYIDNIEFDGEFMVDEAYKRTRPNRGGSGIVKLTRENGVWLAVRDIVLEPHPA